MSAPELILASGSAARREMLQGAGVLFRVEVAPVDEAALKAELGVIDAAALAVELAKAKAVAVSRLQPDAWVLGGDQTLAFDGGLVSKARSLEEAKARLSAMRGRSHALHSGAALARGGEVVWSGVETATMQVRPFSDAFLGAYLQAEGKALLSCVGAYRLEGLGAQLFERIDGDYFTVLGLPLWAVLKQLRHVGALPA
ncbi:nucleoside triphosphate pyrophosphatase [Brevundimonas sp. PAMC22021]|uniref:Maf family protein n=1 Tax=Brevundimonas sp. PAMC22021 TaxID=2861285 RepID=UPI001C638830|nr:nucleoside triphosphate pyrophosphatase [Brevundimonas sp. PAMC22021]QYF86718.1 Maf family protein [Brevundimonas sp. PAMC22021]